MAIYSALFLGCVSEIDKTEAREVGIKAVHFAKLGNQTGSVTIHERAFII